MSGPWVDEIGLPCSSAAFPSLPHPFLLTRGSLATPYPVSSPLPELEALPDFRTSALYAALQDGAHRALVWVGSRCNPALSPLPLVVHLEGFCGGTRFDCKDVKFIVGEGEDHDIPIGIDKALEKMQRGEHCILYLAPR